MKLKHKSRKNKIKIFKLHKKTQIKEILQYNGNFNHWW